MRLPRRLLTLAVLLAASTAGATHFRYGHLTWQLVGGATVEFTLQNVFRRNDTPSFNPCVAPATNTVIACSGGDGLPLPGDVIREDIGDTRLNFGDGSPTVGSPGNGGLFYLVTSVDPVNNWVFGLAIDPASLPAIDTSIAHTYPAPGTYVARIDDCCRIAASVPPNAHINNPEFDYRVETRVVVGGGNNSAVSALPPIVICPQNAICSFLVPATDPDGDALTFRLSTAPEADGGAFTQPGPPTAANAASVHPTSGVYTWNTTGATLGPVNLNTLYSTQVTIEERDASNNLKGKVAIDFFIQLVPDVNDPPVFQQPACNTTLEAQAGIPLGFTVEASDPDAGDVVTLNVAGLPAGASTVPPLPTSGNPVSTVLAWTPLVSQGGSYVVTFTATDSTSQQALCPVTIVVTSQCGDGDLDPGEQCDTGPLAGDCCTDDCQFEPDGTACNGGPTCGGPDTCQSGACTPGAGGGDADGDGVIDCLDDCPTVADPAQQDLDGDGLGDLCDPEDAPLKVTRLKLKGDRSSTRDNGLVAVKGHFVALGPAEAFTGAQGVSGRIQDELETDVAHTWATTDCALTPSTGRLRCLSADKRFLGDFKPVPATPNAVRYRLKFKGLQTRAPFKNDVTVILTYGAGIDRVGRIKDCAAGNASLTCKEF
jgi:hypothetical protein